MQTVTLEEKEWQVVMGLMSLGPWRDANPLLMKIGQQLQAQDPANRQAQEQLKHAGIRLDGNGREIRE
jgi:hypothetical protein